ncbi:MAG: hypothetical protein U0441_38275 [Polyangiaceae bacterium]
MNHRKLSFLVPLVCVAAVGCGNSGQASSSASTTSGAPAATSAGAQTASSGASSASAAAPKPGSVPSTPEPDLKEWGAASEITAPGSGALRCETKMVREWLRVMCVPRMEEVGEGATRKTVEKKPLKIDVKKGRSGPKPQGENLTGTSGIVTLITQVLPGADIEAEFQWAEENHTLTVLWPADKPQEEMILGFDYNPNVPWVPPDGFYVAEGDFPVKGSSALGCETKLTKKYGRKSWLRVTCAGPSQDGGRAISVDVTKGGAPGKTKTETGSGVVFYAPLSEGMDMEAVFKWSNGEHKLTMQWPKGVSEAGRIVAFDYDPNAPLVPDPWEYDKNPEVNLSGSTAARCETKIKDGWLRVACNGANDAGGTPVGVKVTKGDATTTWTDVKPGKSAWLFVKYQPGVDVEAEFEWSDKKKVLAVKWPESAKTQPDPVGAFK